MVALFLPLDQTAKTEIGMAAVNGAAIFGGGIRSGSFYIFLNGRLDKCFFGYFQPYPHSAAGRFQSLFSFLPYKWNNFEIFLEKYGFFHSFVFSILFFFRSFAGRFLFCLDCFWGYKLAFLVEV